MKLVLQTGNLRIDSSFYREFIGKVKKIEFISQEVQEAFILSDQIKTRSRTFFSENIFISEICSTYETNLTAQATYIFDTNFIYTREFFDYPQEP